MRHLLVFGAGGFLGRHLIPALATQGGFQVTAVSSQSEIVNFFADFGHVVRPVCSTLEDFPRAQARDHDIVVNLACAGVAHKDEDGIDSLLTNLQIAQEVCLFAELTRERLLLHFGSDTEQSHLGVYLTSSHVVSGPEAMTQQDASMYSLSKLVQSSLIRHYAFKKEFYAHVIMTPNLYGGEDPPRSLLGQMRIALQAGLPFTVRNPTVTKRFIHVNAFSSYVIALLRDLLDRADYGNVRQGFEVSSVDFVPRTTVAAFAQRQWTILGGTANALILDASSGHGLVGKD
jgi:nucleoside-diphosphate-sugar epimerase